VHIVILLSMDLSSLSIICVVMHGLMYTTKQAVNWNQPTCINAGKNMEYFQFIVSRSLLRSKIYHKEQKWADGLIRMFVIKSPWLVLW